MMQRRARNAVLGDAYEYPINQFADDAGKKGRTRASGTERETSEL